MAKVTPIRKPVYRIVFQNQGNVYELYARKVSQSELFAFVEVEGILFGERTAILVDPSEEKLKIEFAGVKRTHIPIGQVVRIDEVEKEGAAKIVSTPSEGGHVMTFPAFPPTAPGGRPGKR